MGALILSWLVAGFFVWLGLKIHGDLGMLCGLVALVCWLFGWMCLIQSQKGKR